MNQMSPTQFFFDSTTDNKVTNNICCVIFEFHLHQLTHLLQQTTIENMYL